MSQQDDLEALELKEFGKNTEHNELLRSTALLVLIANEIDGTPLARLLPPVRGRIKANRSAILARAEPGGGDGAALNAIYEIATRALAESHKEDTRALVEICGICEARPAPAPPPELRADAVRLRNCLRAITDGTGDGDGQLIAEGRRAVEETGYLEGPTKAHLPDALREAYGEYIALLEDELSDLVGLAHVHGWKSHRFEKGKELRARIAALAASPTGDNGLRASEVIAWIWLPNSVQ